MHDVIPGILEKQEEEIEKKLQIIKPFCKVVHIDILDGIFSEEVSLLDPNFFKQYRDEFFFEAHLMVDDPTAYLKPFAQAGFKRFLGHVEKMKDVEEFVALGQVLGEVGLALDVNTNIDSVHVPLDDLDVLLLMSVKAGESGQEFMPQALDKIAQIRNTSQVPIEIDGGINDKTILAAFQKGANRFVTTSFIFNAIDPVQTFEKLKSSVARPF